MALYKTLMIGFGSIGRRQFKNFRILCDDPVIIVEPDASKHIPEDNTTFFTELPKTLESFDMAFICSPTSLHREHFDMVAPLSPHIFIEKPAAHTMKDMDIILNTASRHGNITMVGCNYRFEEGLQCVRTLLNAGEIGTVLSAHAEYGHYLPNWRPGTDYRESYSAYSEKGGGIVLDRIHEIDTLHWLFGPIADAAGYVSSRSSLGIASEDCADGILRFADGVHASVHLDYLQRKYCCRLKVIGDAGMLEWSFLPGLVRVFDPVEDEWFTRFRDDEQDVNLMYFQQMKHFLHRVETRGIPFNPLEEAAGTLQAALKMKGVTS